MSEEETPKGQWSILEIMGRRILAGIVSEEVHFGTPMCRIDVPANGAHLAFTALYGGSSIYSWTPCSEEVARCTAEHLKADPISVYVPDLSDIPNLRKLNEELRLQLSVRALPGRDPNADYNDND